MARLLSFGGVAIRALWFVVVPALLALLTLRYLVPGTPAAGTSVGPLAAFVERYPVPCLAALFVYFVVILRYWAAKLPGAEHWLYPQEPAKQDKKALIAWAVSLALAVVAAFFVRAVWFQPFRVLSASMLPTLEPGALLVTNPSAYGLRALCGAACAPSRGDVVVFRTPQTGISDPLVKRVIGLPGDTVGTRVGHPTINGWKVPSCNAGHFVYLGEGGLLSGMLEVEFLGDASYLTVYSAPLKPDLQEYVVGPGQVFVMGDNRNNSSDSRAWNDGRGGGLPFTSIMGRVDRLLVGAKRSGDPDWASFWKPLGTGVSVEGLDSSALQRGVEACRAKRPTQTRPPAPGAAK